MSKTDQNVNPCNLIKQGERNSLIYNALRRCPLLVFLCMVVGWACTPQEAAAQWFPRVPLLLCHGTAVVEDDDLTDTPIGVDAEAPQAQYPPALEISEEEGSQEQDKEQVDAFARFSLELYRQLIDDKTKKNKNVVCSPWSAAIALAMLYEGADGETAAEIQKVLQFQGDAKAFEKYLFMIALNARRYGGDNPVLLETANAFCMQADYQFHTSYKTLLQDRFLAELFTVDFKGNPAEAVKQINQWCAKNTHDKIKEIVSESDVSRSRAVIMNAIYFNARWWEAFDARSTKLERFRHADGSISRTPMMNMKKADFGYYETRGFKALAMRYTGNAHMLILLPDKAGGLADLEKSLTPEKLLQIGKQMDELGEKYDILVNVKIPKFEFESTAELIPPLKKMGIKSAFDGSADLSKITSEERLYVSRALQKAMIRVNEEGTEAAAVTAFWEYSVSAMPEKKKRKIYNFYADHPFLFLICENTDFSILFMGRVHQPEKAKR